MKDRGKDEEIGKEININRKADRWAEQLRG
jgi:hypothetical protein